MSCGPSQVSGNVIIFIAYVRRLQAAVCAVRWLRGESVRAIWPGRLTYCSLVCMLFWTGSTEEAELASEWPRGMSPGTTQGASTTSQQFLLPVWWDG